MKKLYTNDVQCRYRVISSIDSLEQSTMELSSCVGQMPILKNEFSSILPKPTNVETSVSKTDQVFMIHTLIKLELEFDNIWE